MNRERKLATDGGEVGSFVENMRELAADAARETVTQVRAKAENAYDYGRQRVERGVESMESYVRENPLQALGMALGAGFLLGFLCRRRG